MTLPDPRNITLADACGSLADLGLVATLAVAAYAAGFFNGYNATAMLFYWPAWLKPAIWAALVLMTIGTVGEVAINYHEQEGI
jgi:hypothetical protein